MECFWPPGDAYMVVSGLPQQNLDGHATEMANMALDVRETISQMTVLHLPGEMLQMRIGLNSGKIIATPGSVNLLSCVILLCLGTMSMLYWCIYAKLLWVINVRIQPFITSRLIMFMAAKSGHIFLEKSVYPSMNFAIRFCISLWLHVNFGHFNICPTLSIYNEEC